MRRTTSVLAAALTAALLLPGATPATAAPGACDPGPVELAGGGDTTLVASQEHVQGYVLRRRLGAGRSCVVPGARLIVRADGTYLGTVAIPCGSSERMFATIQRTARNDDGSSDRPGPVATRTVTCGEAQPAEGEVATALTHAFEPFNTTTPVGGGWWGEQVITNRTDRTLVFDSYSSETYSLLRRGTTVRIGSNTFNDAVAVTPRELAPGAELRERVRLLAANCDAPVPPGTVVLATSPGPSFPAGTVLVGQTILATDKGRSVSDRRALTVS